MFAPQAVRSSRHVPLLRGALRSRYPPLRRAAAATLKSLAGRVRVRGGLMLGVGLKEVRSMKEGSLKEVRSMKEGGWEANCRSHGLTPSIDPHFVYIHTPHLYTRRTRPR